MIKYIIIAILLFLSFNYNLVLGIIATVVCMAAAAFLNRSSLYARKGNAAFHDGDQQKALAYYKKAYDTNNASPNTILAYAILLLRNAKPQEAITLFNLIVVNNSAKPDVKNKAKQYRALAMYKSGQTEDAIEEAEELFESYKNTVTYSLIGYLKLATKAPIAETLQLCKEAYEYNSDDRDICDNLALAYIENEEYDKAKEILKELIKNQPEFTEAFYHMALAYHKTGDKKAAKKMLEELSHCNRTYMTTVSEDEIEELKAQL